MEKGKKYTVSQILGIDEALHSLVSHKVNDLGVEVMWDVISNVGVTKKVTENYKQILTKVFEGFAEGEGDKKRVPPDKIGEYEKAIEEVTKREETLELKSIPFDKLKQLPDLVTRTVMLLEPILKR